MRIDPIHVQTLFTHRLRDGRVCRFRPFCWPDMMALLPAFSRCRVNAPWLDVLLRSAFAADGLARDDSADDPVAVVFDMLFDKRYCSVPLSRAEREVCLDANDLSCLLSMSLRLAGLADKDSSDDAAEKSGAPCEFDVDGCISFVMRSFALDWWRVRRLTWAQLLWHYDQANVLHMRYDAPMHGVDTSKMLKDRERRLLMERARKALRASRGNTVNVDARTRLAALPPGRIPDEQVDSLWNDMQRMADVPTHYDPEKLEQMESLKAMMAG